MRVFFVFFIFVCFMSWIVFKYKGNIYIKIYIYFYNEVFYLEIISRWSFFFKEEIKFGCLSDFKLII